MPRSTQTIPFKAPPCSPLTGEKKWPEKHSRYLSEWESNVVVINTAHKESDTQTRTTYDLADLVIAVGGGLSAHRSHKRVVDLPEFLGTLKVLINATCAKHHRGDVAAKVTTAVANAIRIYIWAHRQGVPHLRLLTRGAVESLVRDVSQRGWWHVLEYDHALRSLLERAKSDPALVDALQSNSSTKHDREGRFKAETLARELAMPWAYHFTPTWFSKEFAQLLPKKLKDVTPRKGHALKNVKDTVLVLNALASMPPGFDGVPFFPYANVSDAGRKFAVVVNDAKDGRTQNIDLETATAIFQSSVRWIYNYLPGLVELGEVARDELEKSQTLENRTCAKHVSDRLAAEYPRIRDKYKLPFPEVTLASGPYPITRLFDFAFTAATCLIASNHGRRRNEVIGFDKPYGLYFGCVAELGASPSLSKIDIYIEKSIKEYATFWCNKLVKDTVTALEQLRQLFRPLCTEPLKRPEADQEARKTKLLCQCNFTQKGFSSPLIEFDWAAKANDFFTFHNIPATYSFANAHPFRRLFALIYCYRFEHPVLVALSEHLVHLGPEQTQIYVTDPKSRRDKKRIQILYAKARQETADTYALLDNVRSEMFTEKILGILNGELTGGGFPRLVLKFIKRMSASATFREMSASERATCTRDRMEAHGYQFQESQYTGCAAGSAKHTRKASNCAKDGQVHHERACPETCMNCVHGLKTDTYIEFIDMDAEELERASRDTRVRPHLRQRQAAEAVKLREIAARERQLAEGTRRLTLSIIQAFPKTQEAEVEK